MTASPLAPAPQPGSVPEQEASGAHHPAVSVIIATYNSGPLIGYALNALHAQTLPADLIEILVVDDGSTDDTWHHLAELAAQRTNIKIFRQPHTGGPSAGRNRALAKASGEFVFFHDADDYLGPDALRRLLNLARKENSDIVVGRVSWIGRPEAEAGFVKTIADADIVADGVWRSLTPHKLIRRSLIEQLRLRFCDDMVQGEDQVFMASCLFAARKISILGERDLYHRRLLPDGTNLSRQRQTLANKRLTASRMVGVVVANTTPGARRDRLLRRVFVRTIPPALNRPFMQAQPAERKEFLEVMRAEVFPYLPHSVLGELGDRQRLRMLTAKAGEAEDLVELNKVLRSPMPLGEGELPTYTLSPKLDRLLSAEDRQVGAPRLAGEPILCHAMASRNRLTIVVQLGDGGGSSGRVRLAGWQPGSSDFVDLGLAVSEIGSMLTFKISPRQLWNDEAPSSKGLPASGTEQRHWIALLRTDRKGTMIGASPIIWPQGLQIPAKHLARRTRNPQIEFASTPGGSLMITLRRPKRSPTWHRPRLVV
jgi:poly(ribitol-phosphate) beta-N-acetylglucosaminyltransferase